VPVLTHEPAASRRRRCDRRRAHPYQDEPAATPAGEPAGTRDTTEGASIASPVLRQELQGRGSGPRGWSRDGISERGSLPGDELPAGLNGSGSAVPARRRGASEKVGLVRDGAAPADEARVVHRSRRREAPATGTANPGSFSWSAARAETRRSQRPSSATFEAGPCEQLGHPTPPGPRERLRVADRAFTASPRCVLSHLVHSEERCESATGPRVRD